MSTHSRYHMLHNENVVLNSIPVLHLTFLYWCKTKSLFSWHLGESKNVAYKGSIQFSVFPGAAVLHGCVLTTDARNRPVASDTGWKVIKFKDKGSSVGVCVVISGSDVDAVDISAPPLTDLRLLGYEGWGVVINIYQIDLQRACAAGGRRAWEQRRGRRK